MQYSRCGNYRRNLISTQDAFNHTAQYHEQVKLISKITVYGKDRSTWYETDKSTFRGQKVRSIVLAWDKYVVQDSDGGEVAFFNEVDSHYSVAPEFVWMDGSSVSVQGAYGGPTGFLSSKYHVAATAVTQEAKDRGVEHEESAASENSSGDQGKVTEISN